MSKLPELQFHEKIFALFDFTSFFAWTFLKNFWPAVPQKANTNILTIFWTEQLWVCGAGQSNLKKHWFKPLELSYTHYFIYCTTFFPFLAQCDACQNLELSILFAKLQHFQWNFQKHNNFTCNWTSKFFEKYFMHLIFMVKTFYNKLNYFAGLN